VYLARATGEAGFERPVALKVLHPHMARRPEAVNHFLDEARLASRLDHPSIVAVHDLGRTGNEYFIAMEYVDGPDLDRLLRSMRDRAAQVPLAVALTILRRVCDGLHAAHTAVGDDGAPLHLIHRDVKTGNVLLSRQGAVKIGDFGIARAATTIRTTTIGETKGTAEVMAPEQRMGHDIDVRADVFAVAALGYELLTGAAVNLDLAILAQLGVEGWPHLPMPSTLRPELPVELDAILIGALAYERSGRPDSCAALEEKLAAAATRHGLVCGDKEIAAWLATELPRLSDPSMFTAVGTPPVEQAALA
jgi:serine/threonine protein kinase